ncbi:MAG: ABC transporter substrate-binding protein [Clostridia bacterium]|nr:ABC transporter substrate-binding protein [Clostridia bacterium]
MKLKLLSILLVAVMLPFALVGCRNKTTARLRINEVTHSIFYAPFYAANELGFFKEAGIEIELTNGGGSDKSMTALLTGSADIGFMGPETAVYVYNEGQKDYPVIIAQVTRRDGSFLVGKTPDPQFSWEKLRGKSVIGGRTGGMPEMTLEYVLRAHGINPKTDLNLRTDVSFDLMGGAFLAGEDDYVALFEPSASTMELAGEGYIVASIGQEADAVAYTAMMVTQSFRDTHKALLQSFVNALYRGQTWVAAHTAEEVAAAIKPAFPDSDMTLLTKVVANYQAIGAWKTEPTLEKADFDQLLRVIRAAGIEVEHADYDKVVDNQFAQKVS